MYPVQVGYDPNQDAYVGATMVHTVLGPRPVFAVVRLRPIGKVVARVLMHRSMKRAGFDPKDQVGFGFMKKAWKGIWKKAKKIARAVGVAKVVGAVTKKAGKVLKAAGK